MDKIKEIKQNVDELKSQKNVDASLENAQKIITTLVQDNNLRKKIKKLKIIMKFEFED